MAGVWEPFQPVWLDPAPQPEVDPYAPVVPVEPIASQAPTFSVDEAALVAQAQPEPAVVEQPPAPQWADLFAQQQGGAPVPVEVPQPTPAPMQPGLGVPAMFVDQAVEPPAPSAPAQPQGDMFAPDANGELDPELVHAAANNPFLQAALQAAHDHNAAQFIADRQIAINDEAQRRVDESLRVRQDAVARAQQETAAISARAMELASTKVDPERWHRTRNVGHHIANLVGAIAGGVMANSNGGRNPYLESMEREIDRDIDAQKADIQNGWQGVNMRRGLVAEEYARSGDLAAAIDTARLATMQVAYNRLSAERMKYGANTTRGLALQKAMGGLSAQMNAAQAAAAKNRFDMRLKAYEEMRKQREADDKHALDQAKLAKAGKGGTKKDRPITPDYDSWLRQTNRLDSQESKTIFQEVFANTQRAQARWDAANKSAASVATPSIARPSPSGGSQKPAAPPAPSALQPTPPQAAAAAQTPTTSAPVRYTSRTDWYAKNVPGSDAAERKRYWFVDGKDGNEVDPVRLEDGVDPEKFIDRQSKRQALGEKVSQLILLTERLRNKGLWKKVKNHIPWAEDGDVMEARSLAEEVTGDVIQEKGMGVPSGNDVDRVKTMAGGDPMGWKDPTEALQRYRQSLQIAQDRDWKTATPSAFEDPRYAKYRNLPTADAAFVEKLQRRGEVKTIRPEFANTDPKQLNKQEFAVAGDAPTVEKAQANEEFSANAARAAHFLEAAGVEDAPEVADDTLIFGGSSRAVTTPQLEDFVFSGPPAAAKSFERLRKQYTNGVANIQKYRQNQDPKQWNAFLENRKQIATALGEVLGANGKFLDLVPPSKRMTWMQDDELVAHLANVVLRNGGK